MKKKIAITIVVLLSVIVGLSAYSRFSKRIEPAYASDRNITISDSFDLPVELLDAIRIALLNYPLRLFDTDEYEIKSARLEGDWVMISLGVLKMPEDVERQFETGEITDWGTPLFGIIGRRNVLGKWDIGLDDTDEYIRLILESPDWYLTPEAKKILGRSKSEISEVQTVNYKFPWPAGVSLTMSQGWHKTGTGLPYSDWYAFDFFRIVKYDQNGNEISPENRRVVLSSSGYVSYICATGTLTRNIHITDASGAWLGYWHIDKNTFPDLKVGDSVNLGQVVGKLKIGGFSYDGCGYSTQGVDRTHIHWILPHDRQLPIDGFTVTYPNSCFYKNGQCFGLNSSFSSTNVPVEDSICSPPPSGVWTISQSCKVSGTVQYLWGNIIITNNSTVTVMPGGYFDVDVAYYSKLVIKPGSKLIIKPGGRLQ